MRTLYPFKSTVCVWSATLFFWMACAEIGHTQVTGELQSAYRPDLDFDPIACDLETARRFVGDRLFSASGRGYQLKR